MGFSPHSYLEESGGHKAQSAFLYLSISNFSWIKHQEKNTALAIISLQCYIYHQL